MSYWVFRGNREAFDIDSYLAKFNYIYWAVKHQKHRNAMHIGDPVFIWRSKGKSKNPYGVVAFGKIVEGPVHKSEVKYPEHLLEEYWEKPEVSPFKVGIDLRGVRLSIQDGLVDSSLLLSDPLLKHMHLLTARQGTNFPITQEQYQRIISFWCEDAYDLEEDEYETAEGKATLRLHKYRERDRTLVRKAKENFISIRGRLYCEICNFDFQKMYGQLGEEFIEAHHVKPLSEIKAGEKTKIVDLAMLCANCHRMIHRIKTADPMKTLCQLAPRGRVAAD